MPDTFTQADADRVRDIAKEIGLLKSAGRNDPDQSWRQRVKELEDEAAALIAKLPPLPQIDDRPSIGPDNRTEAEKKYAEWLERNRQEIERQIHGEAPEAHVHGSWPGGGKPSEVEGPIPMPSVPMGPRVP